MALRLLRAATIETDLYVVTEGRPSTARLLPGFWAEAPRAPEQELTVKKQIALVFAALASAMAGTSAQAGTHVSWSVGINVPPVATVVTNAPVYAPAPVVYAPPPVYVEEPVVYVPPPPRVVYRPVPVVVQPSYYYSPAPVIYSGTYYRSGWYGGRGWHHHDQGWRSDGRWHDRGGQPGPVPRDDTRRRH
jgi:hypothetical protein